MEPPFAERSVVYHKDYIVNGRIVTSDAINFTENEVLTEDGNRIAYDYLVIATGHKDPVPESRSERLDQFKTGKTVIMYGDINGLLLQLPYFCLS